MPTLFEPTTTLADATQLTENVFGHIVPYELFSVGPVPFTNHMFMVLVAATLVFLVFRFTASRVRTGPHGAQDDFMTEGRLAQFFEAICVFIREYVVRPQLGGMTDRYIGYIWTVFFFILFTNLLGAIPIGSIAGIIAAALGSTYPGWWAHWWGTATTNIAVTSALASLSLVAIVAIGVREQGKHYFAHFAPVPFKPWPMIPVSVLLVALEVLGLFVKCFVLAMRLFGVMTGGHMVLAVLIGLTFLFASYLVGVAALAGALAISILELFIASLQAFIFTFLTTLFIAAGAAHGEHEEHHEHEEHPEPAVAHGVEPVSSQAG